jgi:predicted transcriptional regulator
MRMFIYEYGCLKYTMDVNPAPLEERSPELFFQLSSIDRKCILEELQKGDAKLTELAKRLEMTSTETLRQLQRLTEGRLVEKSPEGKYRLTSYAKLVLMTSAPLDFVSRFRDYFQDHDGCVLPPEFRARLAELSGGKLIPIAIESMNMVAEMLRNAREKIDCTIEVGSQLHLEIMMQHITDGVKVRWLMQESFLPMARDILGSMNKLPEMKHIPRLHVHVYQTEKEASIAFRLNSGPYDYATFHGEDTQFLKWASDLYTHEWEGAKPWYP